MVERSISISEVKYEMIRGHPSCPAHLRCVPVTFQRHSDVLGKLLASSPLRVPALSTHLDCVLTMALGLGVFSFHSEETVKSCHFPGFG